MQVLIDGVAAGCSPVSETAGAPFTCDITAAADMTARPSHSSQPTASPNVPAKTAETLDVAQAPQPGQPNITINPATPKAGQTVTVTIEDPNGNDGTTVSFIVDGKSVAGCDHLKLDGNGKATCTWTRPGDGSYELAAAIGSSNDLIKKTVAVH